MLVFLRGYRSLRQESPEALKPTRYHCKYNHLSSFPKSSIWHALGEVETGRWLGFVDQVNLGTPRSGRDSVPKNKLARQ